MRGRSPSCTPASAASHDVHRSTTHPGPVLAPTTRPADSHAAPSPAHAASTAGALDLSFPSPSPAHSDSGYPPSSSSDPSTASMERWVQEYQQAVWAEGAPRIPSPLKEVADPLAASASRPSLERDPSSGETTATRRSSSHEGEEEEGGGERSGRSTPATSPPTSPPSASFASFDDDRGGQGPSSSRASSFSSQISHALQPPLFSPARVDPFTQPPTVPPISLSPRGILSFYREHGYMHAPKGVFETERLRTMKRYGLDKVERMESLERVVRMAKEHFGTATVIISLVLEDRQVLAAETGWIAGAPDPPLEAPPRALPYETSFCAHAMQSSESREPFVVADASKDWRFARNPLTASAGGSLAFYAASCITLPTSFPSSSASGIELPATLPVGAICLIDDKPREAGAALSEGDKRYLNDLAAMVGREFQHGLDQRRRELELQRTAFIGSFLDSTLVYSQPSSASSASADPLTASNLRQTANSRRPSAATSPRPPAPSPTRDFSAATQQLAELTGASAAAIFDLRYFRAPQRSESSLPNSSPLPSVASSSSSLGAGRTISTSASPVSSPGTGTGDDASSQPDSLEGEATDGFVRAPRTDKFPVGLGKVHLLGGAGRAVDWTAQASSPLLPKAICEALKHFYTTGQTDFDSSTSHSAFRDLLPRSASATQIVPIFDVDSSPAILLVVTSLEPYFRFDESDRQFVRNVGAVAFSALLRQRALEAEKAKLSFISTISHELRTPLHGINSQIELLREFSSPEQLLQIAPLLDVADVCLESLRDVLDDTLDFSKLSNNSPEEIEAATQRSLAKHDLAQIAEDVCKAVWVKKKRVDLVSADAAAAAGRGPQSPQGKVDVILEIEERKGGWGVWVDAGGLKRVILNILGNSVKFTSHGSVKLTLSEVPTPSGLPNHNIVQLTVSDTGRGMSEDFLRQGLLLPFARENEGHDGAGLGLSIVDTIIRRMGGKLDVASALGKGTTMRITLPLEFYDSASPTPSPVTRAAASSISTFSGLTATRPPTDSFSPSPTPSATAPRPARAPSISLSHLTFRRRVISDELAALFQPGTKLATPSSEKGAFDFSQAVEAAQASLGKPKLGRIPSLRRKRSGLRLGGGIERDNRATEGDFVDEMARLSVGVASSPSSAALTAPGESYFSILKPPSAPLKTPDGHFSSAPLGSETPTGAGAVGAASGFSTAPTSPGFIPSAPKTRFASRVRVLVADDNPIGRSILCKLFTGKGIAFAQASNGLEAVELYTSSASSPSTRFHLLLTDLHMPLLSGFACAAQIRAFEAAHAGVPRARIVALTGLSGEGDLRRAEESGIDGFLVKGGKNLAVILREIKALEEELKEREKAAVAAAAAV
ncbi:hypothetical protein JCM8097_000055 [Rhodosporidiobolus ruineniae]